MKGKAIILATILAVLVSGCGGATTKTTLKKDQAAKVNGVAITYTQVKTYKQKLDAQKKEISSIAQQQAGNGKQDVEAQAVYDLVWEELLLQEAKKLGIKAADIEVTARIKQIQQATYGGNQKKMEEAIKAQNMTMAQAKESVKKELIGQKLKVKLINDAGKVTDTDIKNYYERNKKSLTEPLTRHLRHMLFKTKADALAAKARLDAGEDFATLAKELSLDVNSKDKGGDLDWVEKGLMAPEFEKVAFSLKVGKYSDPIKTPSGWNIVKVEGIKAGGLPPLKELKRELKQEILNERGENAMNNWYAKVLKENTIELATEYKNIDLKRTTSPHISI